MGWDHGGWDAGQWLAMSAMMLLFWAGLAALVVWAVRSLRPDRQSGVGRPTDRAEALLAERFARGEIDGEELVRSRELLRAGRP
jgi:putative membrane protein